MTGWVSEPVWTFLDKRNLFYTYWDPNSRPSSSLPRRYVDCAIQACAYFKILFCHPLKTPIYFKWTLRSSFFQDDDDDDHHHHHLALQHFVGFRLLTQVCPSSSILRCFLPVFNSQLLFRSSITCSCHRCLGLPTGLIPIGFQSSIFLAGLAWSILWICPSHLILCALISLTTNLSISMLFRFLQILSILTGLNIFLSHFNYTN